MMSACFRSVLKAGFVALIALAAWRIWLAFQHGDFVSPVRIGLYGVLPAAVAFAACLFLFVGHRARLIAALQVGAIVLALAGAEIWVQWQSHVAAEARRMASPPLPALATLMARLRDAGTLAYPQPCGWNLRVAGGRAGSPVTIENRPVLPVGGLAGNAMLRITPVGLSQHIADRQGFNNPPGQWMPGAVEIMAIGDSFTMGADVPFGHGFVDHLRRNLGRTVNLGCNGNGPLFELAGLAEYGPHLSPRVVVWAYYEGNDLVKDAELEMTSPVLPRYLQPGFSQGLVQHRDAVQAGLLHYLQRRTAAMTQAVDLPAKPEIFAVDWGQALRLGALRRALGLAYGFPPESLGVLVRALERAQAITDAWGGRLVFVYLPGEARFAGTLARLDADAYRRRVLDQVTRLDVPVFDLVPQFEAHLRPRDLFANHYTLEGYRLVGDVVLEALRANDSEDAR